MRSGITNRLFIFIFLILSQNPLIGQTIFEGARNQGMGGASVALKDRASLWSNQAGTAFLDDSMVDVYGHQLYSIAELNSIGVGAALATNSGVFGLRLNYLGIPEFNEQKIGISYSRLLMDRLSIGVGFKLLRVDIPEYGSTNDFTFDFGILAELIPNLWIGAHAISPIRVAVLEDENIPTVFSLGVAYYLSQKTIITSEIEKDIEYPVRFKFGVEYSFTKAFQLRFGGSTEPANFHFGLGYTYSSLQIDLAFSQDQTLGITPGLGLNYQFGR